MWKLTIEDDEGTKTLLPLVRDAYHIGRDENNTIRLTERNVSRRHASLKKDSDSTWQIVDHDSYNGCYVNGQRVAGHAKLSHADVVQLGDYRIFVASDAADADATGPNNPQPVPVPPQEKPDRLVMVAGPTVGLEFPLGEIPLSLGRAEECGISINHPSVSRFHAEVRPIGKGRYEITDKGSSNGIRVNTIDFRRTLLEHGDLIELGDVRLRFVERGQIYRPMADMTQQLSALSGKEFTPSTTPVPKARTGVLIGAVAAGVLVMVGLIVMSMSGKGDDPSKDIPASVDQGSKSLLDEARKAAAVGDYDAAVARLSELSVNSAVRQMPDFQIMHDKWAEASIAKAASLVDKSEKKALLTRVTQNNVVSASLRQQATDAIAAIDSGASPTPTTTGTPGGPGAVVMADPGNGGTTSPVSTRTTPGTPTAAPDKTAKKPDKTTPSPAETAVPGTTDDEMKQRKMLEGRMNSGKASKDDLRYLKAICQHQGDAACKARVNDAISKLN